MNLIRDLKWHWKQNKCIGIIIPILSIVLFIFLMFGSQIYCSITGNCGSSDDADMYFDSLPKDF